MPEFYQYYFFFSTCNEKFPISLLLYVLKTPRAFMQLHISGSCFHTTDIAIPYWSFYAKPFPTYNYFVKLLGDFFGLSLVSWSPFYSNFLRV